VVLHEAPFAKLAPEPALPAAAEGEPQVDHIVCVTSDRSESPVLW
jgi:hypothetical protein